VSRAGRTFHITLDPNGRFYRPAEALKIANDLARLDHPIIIEDPFPRMVNLDWHVLFRQKSPIPTGHSSALARATDRTSSSARRATI